jgi:ATP phosphoribosyltransferase
MSTNQKLTNTKSSQESPKREADAAVSGGPGADGCLLKLTIPTGRIQEKVVGLLEHIGVNLGKNGRSYKPTCSSSGLEIKMLKAQNIPNLVALGRHDCGFSGFDWITEQQADVVEVLDLEFDPVRIVAAVPEELAENDNYKKLDRQLVVASEYRQLATDFIAHNKLNAVFLQTFGATEALPPEDADIIVDNTATGTTLRHNRLVEIETLMTSTTRFICNRQAYEDKDKRRKLEELAMLMQASLRARDKVLLEMNVAKEDFPRLVADLPCMRAPTISELYNGDGYAVKIAVSSKDVPSLIPKLVALGARDILEYKLQKIVI